MMAFYVYMAYGFCALALVVLLCHSFADLARQRKKIEEQQQ